MRFSGNLDIEGAWLPVIEHMAASGIRPRMVCVEFDSSTTVGSVRRAVLVQRGLGRLMVHRRRDGYLFAKKAILGRRS
jgi:hypothetical protein